MGLTGAGYGLNIIEKMLVLYLSELLQIKMLIKCGNSLYLSAFQDLLQSCRADMDMAAKSGIMNASKAKEEVQVRLVGKINKEIYKCISADIVTDEVIITDERIAHIKERHPNDYERYYGYLKEIVEHPLYIVESSKPYTALFLKEFMEGEEQFKTVLRLTTSHDNPEFKNSIIAFMKINDKEWKRMLKNKRILYKNE